MTLDVFQPKSKMAISGVKGSAEAWSMKKEVHSELFSSNRRENTTVLKNKYWILWI